MITVWRTDAEYEATRRRMAWNDRIPERFPGVIVSVTSDADVIEAIRRRYNPQGVFYGTLARREPRT
jgi:hypothetical protein